MSSDYPSPQDNLLGFARTLTALPDLDAFREWMGEEAQGDLEEGEEPKISPTSTAAELTAYLEEQYEGARGDADCCSMAFISLTLNRLGELA